MISNKLTATSVAIIAALGMASAQAVEWNQVDFNQPGTSGEAFQGSFNYNGKTYGPADALATTTQAGSTIEANFDLKQLAAKTLYGKNISDDDGSLAPNDKSFDGAAPVVYRIYRQDYSAAIVNLSRGTKGRHFAKSIVGDKTAPDTLTQGDYSYTGVVFSNFPRGNFTYNVKVTGPSSATGEGNFNLNGIKVPPAISGKGKAVRFNITNAVLAKTELVTADGGLKFAGAVSNITVDNQEQWDIINQTNTQQADYDLNLYGPNGKEIAGTISGLPDRVGTVAVIGGK